MRWSAILVILVLATTFTPSAQAQREDFWTVHTSVEADILDHYATVRVIVDIGNDGPDPEFPFVLNLPASAMVTGLTLERDGEVHEATIEDREAARERYEEHKAEEQTGVLVEKQRNSQLFAYLVNTAAFDSVRAVLTYELYLEADRGVLHLPLEAPVSGFGRDLGAAFDVRVAHQDDVAAAWSVPIARTVDAGEVTRLQMHVGPRPDDASTRFDVYYEVGPSANGGSIATREENGVGHFVHRFSAPVGGVEMPLELVLALDVSGSMGGQKIEQMRDAAKQVVLGLHEEDRLHLVPFSSGAVRSWTGFKAMDADGRSEAIDAIDSLQAAGSTNIESALEAGLGAYGSEGFDGVRTYVLLTDGQPTVGKTDRAGLVQVLREANTGEATVYTIAFGRDADWPLVQDLAKAGDGTATRIEEGAGAEVDLRRFLDALSTPLLRDVVVSYKGDVESHRVGTDILYAGSEILLVGTYHTDLKVIEGTVTAQGPTGTHHIGFSSPVDPDGPPHVARVAVYHQILRLQALGATAAAIAELASTYGFVTDETSLVLTLPPSEARPFTQAELDDRRGTGSDSTSGSGGGWASSGTWSSTGTGTVTTTSTRTTTGTMSATVTSTTSTGTSPSVSGLTGDGSDEGRTSTDPVDQGNDTPAAAAALVVLGLFGLVAVLRRRT